ncbi:MAG: hypothetical protein NC915_05940 [Candidatus Omnitrophica bacterium]|nr:hypothetical protein [Candidatus Omnitrophota bacterium]
MKKMVITVISLILFTFLCFSFLHLFIPYLWLKTDQAFHRGRYDTAIEYLSLICFIQPHNSEGYIIKAWLEWSIAKSELSNGLPYKKNLSKAIKTYKKGQKNNPDDWRLYYEEGIMWDAFGEKEKALKLYYISSDMGAPVKKFKNKKEGGL